ISKKFLHSFPLVVLLFSIQTNINAQIEDYINGNKFIKSEGKWYAADGDDRFLVDESVITVKWKKDILKDVIDDFNKKHGLTIIRENILGYIDLRVESDEDILQIVKNYIKSGLVEIAEPNTFGRFGSIPGMSPNDTHFNKQWYLHHNWGYDINAPEAWDITTGNTSVIVGILDSGTDYLHEDLGMGTDGYQNIWLNSGDPWTDPNNPISGDGLDNDGNGYIDDYKGWNFRLNNNDPRGDNIHGTVVGGIIAVKNNNGKGISGVAGGWGSPGVKLLITRIGTGTVIDPLPAYTIDDAILYAVNNGARVINMSFGTWWNHSAINAAIEYAHENGCVLIACTGNGGCDYYCPCQIWYPARHQKVIAVSGTRKDGGAYSANCLTRDPAWGDSIVNISAPAGATIALPPLSANGDPQDYGMFSILPNNQYGYIREGTSLAAPQVAGAAALLLSVRPSLTPQNVKCILETTADDIGKPGYDSIFGWGRLNIHRALQAVILKLQSPANNSIVTPSPTLSWKQLYGAPSYRVQVAANINFINPVYDWSGITSNSVVIPNLSPNTNYFWRVIGGSSLCNVAPLWSDTWGFTTTGEIPLPELELQKLAHQTKEKPTIFSLSENFPDPFNPITKIKYSLPEDVNVTLKVYDILGREIATIVDEQKSAGWHEVEFSTEDRLASGVYIYKIQAGKFLAVNKMILTK
ncbi:MAG: S8 family serine peptidase, partial [Bacteroidota bacterium]|nr:S8 family serine peptidase [Bacteroidota bacterium]